MGWLATYLAATPYITACDNTTVRLDPDNEIQPDALLRIDAKSGGQSRLSKDDYVEGAPELIVEIAASSASYDLHDKKTVCRRHGVPEYVVWQLFENELSWFVLEDDVYLQLEPDEGMIRSRAFPGLHLSAEALREGDLAAVLAAVRAGTESDAHAAFVQQLETAPAKTREAAASPLRRCYAIMHVADGAVCHTVWQSPSFIAHQLIDTTHA